MAGQIMRLVGGSAFVLYILYLTRPGSSLFSWHPFLMTVAFTGLMTEAVFVFSKSSLWSGLPHSTKVQVHWVLLVAAAVAHGLGAAAIYFTKEANNKPHLTSPHGKVGSLAAILLWVQLSMGVFARYPKLVERFLSLKTLRTAHSLYGSLTYAVGIVALVLSLGSAWYKNNASEWSVFPAFALHLLFLFNVFKRHFVRYRLKAQSK